MINYRDNNNNSNNNSPSVPLSLPVDTMSHGQYDALADACDLDIRMSVPVADAPHMSSASSESSSSVLAVVPSSSILAYDDDADPRTATVTTGHSSTRIAVDRVDGIAGIQAGRSTDKCRGEKRRNEHHDEDDRDQSTFESLSHTFSASVCDSASKSSVPPSSSSTVPSSSSSPSSLAPPALPTFASVCSSIRCLFLPSASLSSAQVIILTRQLNSRGATVLQVDGAGKDGQRKESVSQYIKRTSNVCSPSGPSSSLPSSSLSSVSSPALSSRRPSLPPHFAGLTHVFFGGKLTDCVVAESIAKCRAELLAAANASAKRIKAAARIRFIGIKWLARCIETEKAVSIDEYEWTEEKQGKNNGKLNCKDMTDIPSQSSNISSSSSISSISSSSSTSSSTFPSSSSSKSISSVPPSFAATATVATTAPFNHNTHLTSRFKSLAHMIETTSTTSSGRHRVYTYQHVILLLSRLPRQLSTADDVMAFARDHKGRGVGKKTVDKMLQIIRTGHIETAEMVASSEKMTTMDTLMEIHGVGKITATNWFNLGIRTIPQLLSDSRITLTPAQRVGIKHVGDVGKRIPRPEVASIHEYVRAVAVAILPGIEVICCGSYRRGAVSCGDVDLLFTHSTFVSHSATAAAAVALPLAQHHHNDRRGLTDVDVSRARPGADDHYNPDMQREFITALLQRLRTTIDERTERQRETEGDTTRDIHDSSTSDRNRRDGIVSTSPHSSSFRASSASSSLLVRPFITDDLSSTFFDFSGTGVSSFDTPSWMGYCTLPPSCPHYSGVARRLDIKVCPLSQLPFALLSFTGSAQFNKGIRTHAKRKGWKLSDKELVRRSGVM